MKRTILLFAAAVMLSACSGYKYESVKGDPMKSRIYTLENGLKVYMTVNKEEPRIQTYMPVKVGGKCDPAETTGLAHYFEHLMFKGTEQFGTVDFAAEKPLLDQIEQLFEVYRQTTGEAERRAIYHQIDSISYEASKIGIPNEYDKLMAAIGSTGTNAYTSYDQTVYIENIPSNQIENWARIQADRFENNVVRLFHTELETVYEEQNMSLTRDAEKVFDTMLAELFKKHPYGKQSVLGTQEHLKNPSIININNYHDYWYVPNNIAICMSGDFNPDEAIKIIDKSFGQWQPNNDLKRIEFAPEEEITVPVEKEVFGLETEMVVVSWRLPAMYNEDMDALSLLGEIIYNGNAGMLDLNLNQQQKLMFSYAGCENLEDYSFFMMEGLPKQGQTLEEARELLLGQIDALRKGEFSEELLLAAVNNKKRVLMERLESNRSRADMFVTSFINDVPWEKMVSELDDLGKVTKADIVAAANKYLKENNHVTIYKRMGEDKEAVKIAKPHITPIVTNRDKASAFMTEIQNAEVTPVEPLFVDFSRDLAFGETAKASIPVICSKNVTNALFDLYYYFDFGSNANKVLPFAAEYISYLGTATKSAEQIKSEFYKLACEFSISVGADETTISLSGLAENMDAAVALLEEVISGAAADEEILAGYKADVLKNRNDKKLSQRDCFNALTEYARYGEHNSLRNTLSNTELLEISGEEILSHIKNLLSKEHRILYDGPVAAEKFVAGIDALHQTPATLERVEKDKSFVSQVTAAPSVIIAPYDAKQIYMIGTSVREEKFDASKAPIVALYNEYFGSGMNAIVFQEMREARGLCYTARASYLTPDDLNDNYVFYDMIATQNDKMEEAMKAFDEIINNMPQSENAFKIAQDAIIQRLRTSRTSPASLPFRYISTRKQGLDNPLDKELYEKIPTFTLNDVVDFQKSTVAGRDYTICILGDESDLNLKALAPYGPIRRVSLEEIFGF